MLARHNSFVYFPLLIWDSVFPLTLNASNLLKRLKTARSLIKKEETLKKELEELEPRLRSRFEWGITVDIGKPDFETRLAILQEKARAKEFMIPQDVAEFIAANVTENVRELE